MKNIKHIKHLLSYTALAVIILCSVNTMAQCVQCDSCVVEGLFSSAIGKNNTVAGDYSFVGGYQSITNGNNSFTFGNKCSTFGESSFTLGLESTVSGPYSVAIGHYNNINGRFSNVFGTNCSVNAWGALCIGESIINDYERSIIIGTGYTSTNKLSLEGYDKNNHYIAIGLESTSPTLVITRGAHDRTGDVYIGHVTQSEAKLHIHSDLYDDCSLMLTTASENRPTVIYFRNTDNNIKVNQDNIMNFSADGFVFNSGKVGIGCNNDFDGYSLAVKDGIITEKVVIKTQTEWPDFIFGKDYNLMSLPELKKFVAENKHLPDVPSEAEVNENGISVGEMQSVLLQKIEEITLYTIQQHELIEGQQEMMKTQQEMIEQLKKEIEELKSK